MPANRCVLDLEPRRDRAIVKTGRHEIEHLTLARRQPLDRIRDAFAATRRAVAQSASDGRANADDPVDDGRTSPFSAKSGHRCEHGMSALPAGTMLDLEVGRPSLEDCRERARYRLRDRLIVPAVGIEKVRSDRYSGKAGFTFVGRPRFVYPGDVPIGVEDRDRATLQVESGVAHLPVGHPMSVRLMWNTSK